jgi:Leucine-rich repeat (LRR) protein
MSGNGLHSLAGLKKLQQLTTLDLSYSPIKSLNLLAELKRLQTLDLRGTKISSLDGLPPSVTTLLVGD